MVNSSLKVVSVLLASAKILPGSSKHLRTKLISAYIGIGELIAQYYAFKYLKHFPFTLEITVITDRIATFQCIEDYKKKRSDSEMPDMHAEAWRHDCAAPAICWLR